MTLLGGMLRLERVGIVDRWLCRHRAQPTFFGWVVMRWDVARLRGMEKLVGRLWSDVEARAAQEHVARAAATFAAHAGERARREQRGKA